MKKSKPINFQSTSIFSALFTTIILFILEILMLTMFVSIKPFKGNPFLSYSVVYIIFILTLFIIERKTLIKMIHSLKKDLIDNYKNIIKVTISLLLLEFILNFILIKIIGHQPSNNQIIIDAIKDYGYLVLLFYSVILCPILESLIYFYPYQKVKNQKLAFIISSLVFALFHITSSNSLIDILFLIPYFSMSCAFTYGFFKTKNIYVSMIVHSINNILAFVLLLFM